MESSSPTKCQVSPDPHTLQISPFHSFAAKWAIAASFTSRVGMEQTRTNTNGISNFYTKDSWSFARLDAFKSWLFLPARAPKSNSPRRPLRSLIRIQNLHKLLIIDFCLNEAWTRMLSMPKTIFIHDLRWPTFLSSVLGFELVDILMEV